MSMKENTLVGWLAFTRSAGERSETEVRSNGAEAAATAMLRPALKRLFDAGFALTALVAVLPIMLLTAVAIKLDSRGPVFYRVRRVGYRGRPLMMLKFRKMHEDAAGIPLTVDGDPRLTRVGRFLAWSRLDELPQLWHVLRGDMSLVGPRPEDPGFVAMRPDDYEHILSVRPGITGLSQLAYAEERVILDADHLLTDYVSRVLPQKIILDKLYASCYSLRRDLAVLRWTLIALLLQKQVAVHRSTGRLTLRKRPRVQVEADSTPVRGDGVALAAPPLVSTFHTKSKESDRQRGREPAVRL